MQQLYFQPEHWGYRLLNFVHRYSLPLCIATVAVLTAYPFFELGKGYFQQRKWQAEIAQIQTQFDGQAKLLVSLQQFQQEKSRKDGQLAEMNQQIKQKIAQQKASIDSLQWRFGQTKQIDLSVQQQSKRIFPLIHSLAEIEHLHFNQLSLLKLDKGLLQLNAELTVK